MISTAQILEAPAEQWALHDASKTDDIIAVGDKLTVLDAWFGYGHADIDRDHLADGDIRWRWTTNDGRKISATGTLDEAWIELLEDVNFQVMEVSS